ncbi:MAG: ribbon-helix-helix domain-containing protein [Promethearchaeota archaeon]
MSQFIEEHGKKLRFMKSSENKKEPMKNITINIPNQYDELINKLVSLKLIQSRSEAIRSALKDFLAKEFKTLEFYDSFLNDE